MIKYNKAPVMGALFSSMAKSIRDLARPVSQKRGFAPLTKTRTKAHLVFDSPILGLDHQFHSQVHPPPGISLLA